MIRFPNLPTLALLAAMARGLIGEGSVEYDGRIHAASEARALYATAYGRQTGIPTPPALAAGETLVGVFMGQRPTGGYSVRVTGATGQGSTLALRVQVNAPGPGAITTQALTSPWTIVRVSGSFSAASVLDQLGQPLRGPGGNDR